jgi:hypothetical protein
LEARELALADLRGRRGDQGCDFRRGVCVAARPLSSPLRRDAAIKDSFRLYNCARCHEQVRIWKHRREDVPLSSLTRCTT